MLPWGSIFSDNVSSTLQTIESWISSIFFFLFLITVGPWFLFLAYDVVLYLFRTTTYEVPIIGGRARGKERPRAPSLKERPSGDPRVMGIGVPAATYVDNEDLNEERRRVKAWGTSSNDDDDDDDEQQDSEYESEPNQIHTPSDFTARGPQVRASNAENIETRVPKGVGDLGFVHIDDEAEIEGSDRPQRIFSIGGAEERASWTEVNARRRMGFKDDKRPT